MPAPATLPDFFKLRASRDIAAYLGESRALAEWSGAAAPSLVDAALFPWLDVLVRRGMTSLPPFAVAHLLARASSDAVGGRERLAEAPEELRPLLWRYLRAMDDLLGLEKFRPVFREGRTRRNFGDLFAELIEVVAEAVEAQTDRLPAFYLAELERQVQAWRPAGRPIERWRCLPVWESFISGFEAAVAEWRKREPEPPGQGDRGDRTSCVDVEALRLYLPLRIEESPAAWDFEAIERALLASDSPIRWTPQDRARFQRLAGVRADLLRFHGRAPGGGFVGLRANGGIEDIGSVTPSELALPRPALISKAFHRRLQVFERPLQNLHSRRRRMRVMVRLAGDSRLREGPEAVSPRAEVLATLVRLVRELAEQVHGADPGEIPLELQTGAGEDVLDLAVLGRSLGLAGPEAGRRAYLPYFLDPLLTGGLYQLFLRSLASGPETGESGGGDHSGPSPAAAASPGFRPAARQSAVVAFLGFGESSGSDPWRGPGSGAGPLASAADTWVQALWTARGWGLSSSQRRRMPPRSGLTSEEAVRQLVLELLEALSTS